MPWCTFVHIGGSAVVAGNTSDHIYVIIQIDNCVVVAARNTNYLATSYFLLNTSGLHG